jgi:hypothetical protein
VTDESPQPFGLIRRIIRFFARIGTAVIGLIVVLASIAEVLGFVFQYNNVVVESIRNLFQPQPHIPQCIRYESRPRATDCDSLVEASQRMLCRITVQPTERVCVEYGGASATAGPTPSPSPQQQ